MVVGSQRDGPTNEKEKRFYWDYTFISEICIDKLIMYFLIEYDGIVLYLGFKVEVSSKTT